VNSAGEFNLDVDFSELFEDGNAISALFEHEGTIVSCFISGRKAVLYKDLVSFKDI